MGNDLARVPYVAHARPAKLGALLRLGPEPLSLCWSNPSRQVSAVGLGVAAESLSPGDVTWLGDVPTSAPPGPWFGGWAFDSQRAWSGFDAERWVLPEVLAWWDGSRAWLAAFAPAGTSVDALSLRLDAVTELEPQSSTSLAVHEGDRAAWNSRVEAALETIGSGACTKIVLARVIEVDGVNSERALLKSLEARHPTCWTFLIRGRDGRAFIGSSPETLLESRGDEIFVDALAGTTAVGKGAELLRSDKDLREHAAVVHGIRESLLPLVRELQIPPAPVVKALANVEHLFTPVRATLKSGVRAIDVAKALHPTPAVAGTPRDAAMAWLHAHEGFSRGWYTGAVGAVGPGGIMLAVALRSALLDGSRAQVFVGAGLVAGSTAESEWLETERKSWAITGGVR